MPRTLTKEQGYVVVNNLYEQITGQKAITVVDDTTFTSVVSSVKKYTPNQIISGLSEVMSRIEISIRPYTAPFRLNWNDESEYGSHTMKISYIDNANAETDPAYSLADGQTLGQHTVKLPKVYEGSKYGSNVIMARITLVKDQLLTAMDKPTTWARFLTGLMQNIKDQQEQQRQAICQANMINLIGGVYSMKDSEDLDVGYMKNSTIHLLTEWTKFSGQKPGSVEALRGNPAQYEQFIKFVFQRLTTVSKELTNRDKRYHMNPIKDPAVEDTGGVIMRHTPVADQRCYICDPFLDEIQTQVLSSVFNAGQLRYIPHERIRYWQSPEAPASVKVTPQMFNKDGTTTAASEQNIDNLFAVIYDRDAAGVGVVSTETGDTPYDVEKKAKNRYWHTDVQSWNDFTEKCVVFVLD